jgi:hypothetical protein
MCQVSDLTSKVIADFVNSNLLFTALDVSNKVKETLPFARHREVRDFVRNMFVSDIEPFSYARTPIDVTLPDNSKTTALLYHPLSESWNLDAAYDNQKRTQASNRPTSNATLPTVTPAVPTLNLITKSVVNDFVSSLTLFTALDVLNKVNEQLPSAKYKQVRDLVRDTLFDTEMYQEGYITSTIPITLENGDQAFTLLYHHYYDDESLYDSKKRSQTSVKPSTTNVVPAPVQGNLNTAFGAPNTTNVSCNTSTTPTVSQSWRDSFQTKTSLFPRT